MRKEAVLNSVWLQKERLLNTNEINNYFIMLSHGHSYIKVIIHIK